jgi:hypothetical protein
MRISRRMPQLMEKAAWKLSGGWKWFIYGGMLLLAGLFLIVGLSTLTFGGLALFFGLFAAGCLYYYLRWRYLKNHGIDIVALARDFNSLTVSELDVE